ncbi:sensory rhodopsin transducer [Halobacteriales archaeon QS_9_68_17]|nr:MAG: sensory rhodopsin transducer [Halobacteriales archaeon QS_9_68_17]
MIGKQQWATPEGYIPADSTAPTPEPVSHETVRILDATEDPARVEITVSLSDRDPAGPYERPVDPERTERIQFNDLEDPEIPRGEGFASVVGADVPVVCQHARPDSRQAENALLSTMAFPGDG